MFVGYFISVSAARFMANKILSTENIKLLHGYFLIFVLFLVNISILLIWIFREKNSLDT